LEAPCSRQRAALKIKAASPRQSDIEHSMWASGGIGLEKVEMRRTAGFLTDRTQQPPNRVAELGSSSITKTVEFASGHCCLTIVSLRSLA